MAIAENERGGSDTAVYPDILVVGDVAWQVVLAPDPKEKDRFFFFGDWIGAPLLKEMIDNALVETDPSTTADRKLNPDYKELQDSNTKVALIEDCGQFIAVLAPYPRKSRSDDKKDKVMRLSQDLRARMDSSRGDGATAGRSKFSECLELWTNGNLTTPRLVVIYDRNISLRKDLDPMKVLVGRLKVGDALMLAIGEDLNDPNTDELDSRLKDLVDSIPDEVRMRTTILVTVDSLRKYGLPIVESGSIEQAVRDVVGHLEKEPLQSLRRKCKHLVVAFREAAVLYVLTPDGCGERIKGSFHFCPNSDRIAQADFRRYGSMPAKVWIIVAALVKQIRHEIKSNSLQPWDLAPGIRLGVSAFNNYWSRGFEEGKPFDLIKKALDLETRKKLQADISKRTRQLLISSLEFDTGRPGLGSSWSRLDAIINDDKNIKRVLFRIVIEGVDTAFRSTAEELPGTIKEPWFPGYAITCPYAEFGSIKTVDEREIGSFTDLGKLIYKYLTDEDWDKPLSIAVFGPPGSGKSFAVKEILRSVSPVKSDREPLNFNLAQFSSVDQLIEAFHQVQDRALSSDDVPLVIFDEFDSHFGGIGLGWLKYFLAPMQDGLFRGLTQDYRVGRSIFLFSGGTASNFMEFREKLSKEPQQRAQVKLNDFLSRLRGHLDVLDINETGERSSLVKVRRAMLLRSLLEKHAKPILRPGTGGDESNASIQRDVIDRFLYEWKYEHGVRSMESVIQMSRWIDGCFVLASLPTEAQLASHVSKWADQAASTAGAG
jgi:ATPase family associated with various cellular activities (AAA)